MTSATAEQTAKSWRRCLMNDYSADRLAFLGDAQQLAVLRFPFRFLVGREGYQMTFALIFLFAWSILGVLIAAAFARTAGKC